MRNDKKYTMLKYIHQFVQTFLREASKTRPKSRKSSKSTVDITKEKSSIKPEIFAIDFNNEGQEAEHSKEILELKRTYDLLMKKFVNPKLDLMTGGRMVDNMTLSRLKENQEIIRSIINKIFNESRGYSHRLEALPGDISKENVKPTATEDLAFGWSGQPTSKKAANPMVETSSRPNQIAAALFSYPEAQEPSVKKGLQIDKSHKQHFKVNALKRQVKKINNSNTISKSEQPVELDSKAMKTQTTSHYNENLKELNKDTEQQVITALKQSDDSHPSGAINKMEESDSVSSERKVDGGNLDIKTTNKSAVESKKETKHSGNNIDKSYHTKESPQGDQHIPPYLDKDLDIDKWLLNRHRDTVNASESHNNDKTTCQTKMLANTQVSNANENKNTLGSSNIKNSSKNINYKKNINIIRSIAKEDKSHIEKSETLQLKEKNNTMDVIKGTKSDLKDIAKGGISIHKKKGKNIKPCLSLEKQESGIDKEVTPNITGKNKPVVPNENIQLNYQLDNPNTPSVTVEAINTDTLVDKPHEKVSAKNLKKIFGHKFDNEEKSCMSDSGVKNQLSNSNEGTQKENVKITQGNTLVLSKNIFEGKENYSSKNNEKILVSTEQSSSSEHRSPVDKLDHSSPENLVQESTKNISKEESQSNSSSSYWSLLTDRLLRNAKKSEKVKDDFELNKFKHKNINHVTDTTNNNVTKIPDKQNTVDTTSKEGNISKSNIGFNSTVKGDTTVKTAECQNTILDENSNKRNNSPSNQTNHYYNDVLCKSDSNVIPRKSTDVNIKEDIGKVPGKDLKRKGSILKSKSTVDIDLKNDEKSKTGPRLNESSSTSALQYTADESSKIKKLLRRFKKLQKNNAISKQNSGNVKKISYTKNLIDRKFKKSGLFKFKQNKDKNVTKNVRKVSRTKLGRYASDRNSLQNTEISQITRSNPPSVAGSDVTILNTKRSGNTTKKKNISTNSVKTLNSVENKIKINKINSNIFPDIQKNVSSDYQCTIKKNRPSRSTLFVSTSKSIDSVTKPIKKNKSGNSLSNRKLHSKKTICKPINLQMYGVKRNIYTYTKPKISVSNIYQNESKLYMNENVGEPHLLNDELHPLITQVRSLNTREYTGGVKRSHVHKRNILTSTEQNRKKTLIVDYTKKDPIEDTVNISSSLTNKLDNDPQQGKHKHLSNEHTDNSTKEEPAEDAPVQEFEIKLENEIKIKEKTEKSISGNDIEDSSISTFSKANDNIEVLYNRPENPDDHLSGSTSENNNFETSCVESIPNVDLKLEPIPLEGNTQKWKSKSERLQKWKTGLKDNNTETIVKDQKVLDAETKKCAETRSNDSYLVAKTDESENNIVLKKDNEEKLLLTKESYKYENKHLKNDNSSNADIKKCDVKKNKISCTTQVGKIKSIETEHSNKFADKNLIKNLKLATKYNFTQNSCEKNTSIPKTSILAGSEAYNTMNGQYKKNNSVEKMKEFESKLKDLELKLKLLELKSIEDKNSEKSLKSIIQKHKYPTLSKFEKGSTSNIKNKIGIKENNIKHTQLQNPLEMKKTEIRRKDSLTQSKLDINNLIETVKSYEASTKQNKHNNDSPLSLKVKDLEQKLKNLELKLNNLSVKPSKSIDKNYISNIHAKSSASEIAFKHNLIQRKNKLHNEENQHSKTNDAHIKIANFRAPEQPRTTYKRSVTYTKPEMYLKNYFSTNENYSKNSLMTVKNQGITNIKGYSPTRGTIPHKEVNLKEIESKNNSKNNINTITNKIKQTISPKNTTRSVIKTDNRAVLQCNKPINLPKSYNSNAKANPASINTLPDHAIFSKQQKEKYSRPTAKMQLNENILKQNVNRRLSYNNIEMKDTVNIPKKIGTSNLSQFFITPVKQNTSSEPLSETQVEDFKTNYKEGKKENYTTKSKKKNPKKFYSIEFKNRKKTSKTLSKRNLKLHVPRKVSKYMINNYTNDGRNTLHDGLLKSVQLLKSMRENPHDGGGNTLAITNKTNSSSQINLSVRGKRIKTPQLPKKLSNNLKSLSKTAVKSKNLLGKIKLTKTDDVSEYSQSELARLKAEMEGNNNVFANYRPKKRTEEITHPIERKKYGIKFPTKTANSFETLHSKQLSQNSYPYSDYSGKEMDTNVRKLSKFDKTSNKKLTNLISHNNRSINSIIHS